VKIRHYAQTKNDIKHVFCFFKRLKIAAEFQSQIISSHLERLRSKPDEIFKGQKTIFSILLKVSQFRWTGLTIFSVSAS